MNQLDRILQLVQNAPATPTWYVYDGYTVPEPEEPEKPSSLSYKARGGSADLSEEQQKDCDTYMEDIEQYNLDKNKWDSDSQLARQVAYAVEWAQVILFQLNGGE